MNEQNIKEEKMIEKAAGVLGGLGPLATVYFMELIIMNTKVSCDQDHLNMVVLNHATIPDRTDFIVGKSDDNPLPIMIEDAKKLEIAGADFIVMPCNTAHHFYEEIRKNVKIEMVSIIEETIIYAVDTVPNLKKIGILATEGTIKSKTYDLECQKRGIICEIPTDSELKLLMHIIYDEIKAGHRGNPKELYEIINSMIARGCDAVVLGCTELSVMYEENNIHDEMIIDSLTALARKTIIRGGKKIRMPQE